ncbi:hypothetical protein [Streptomyces sp. CB02009]|uniref:hypothetical protein n=1 Tax=Streptomyces sp. CB02009 TaxID=1703938 RepID=UPI00403E6E20
MAGPRPQSTVLGREVECAIGIRAAMVGPGTTSAYFRTRAALLTCVDGLVFDRLVNGGDVPREALDGLVAAALR